MAVCAKAVQQPDGSYLLALDPAVTDVSACAYVVQSGTDSAWQDLANMSISDAQVIGAYVGGVWAIAWGFKAIAKSFLTSQGNENE